MRGKVAYNVNISELVEKLLSVKETGEEYIDIYVENETLILETIPENEIKT